MNQLVNLLLGSLSQLQTKCHIVIYGHMGIQSVVLEYHGDISVLGLYIVYQFAVDIQFTGGNVFQTCNHTKGSGLTASRWTYENNEFLVSDLQVKIFYCYKSVRVCLCYILQ